MLPRCFAVVLLLSAATVPVSADKQPAAPTAPSPAFATVVQVDKKHGHITCQYVPGVTWSFTIKSSQGDVRQELKAGVAFTLEYPLRQCQVYDAKGAKLTGEAAWGRLTKGMTVLVSFDRKPVERAYLRVVRDDTLVIVPTWRDPKGYIGPPGKQGNPD